MPRARIVGTATLAMVAVICLLAQTVGSASEEARSLTEEFVQRSWTREQGLPDNQIQCLLQTRDGYLWIGTKNGLARFDGLKFTVFNRANTPLMESDDCQALEEDAQSNLWISTRSALLRFSNQELRRFGQPDGLCGGPVYGAYSSKWAGLWIVSHGWLNLLHDGKMTCYGKSEGLLGRINALQEDEKGVLWIGQEKALQRFDPQTTAFSTNCLSPQWGHTTVQTLQRDTQGNLWAAFMETEAPLGAEAPIFRQWVHWFADGGWQSCPGNPHGNEGRRFFILPDQEGSLWMPAGFGHVLRLRTGKLERFALTGAGQNSWAQCALEDRERNLWFGTESGGLQCWRPRKVVACTAREGLAHDNSWTICEGRDRSVWIGTDGGISQFQNGKTTNFGEREGLDRKEVRSVAEDRAGTLWVGTMSGLFAFHGGKFTRYKFPGKWFEGKVRTMVASQDGGLWVGTAAGLNRLHDGVHTKYSTTNGLAHIDVRALLEDRTGNLWIGTAGGGVQRFRDGEFTTFTTTNGLSANSAWALHEDASGTLWIGTENGLNRLRDGNIKVFTTHEGLPDNLVNYILEDDDGRLWISHDHGIYWVRKQELDRVAAGQQETAHCVIYDESDGLPGLETNGQKATPPAARHAMAGFGFPTTKGVAVIDPTKARLDTATPLPVIEQVRANGKLAFDNVPNNADETGAVQTPRSGGSESGMKTRNRRLPIGPVQFAPGRARVLEFRYTANTFVASDKARFRYRLLGLDDHWIEAGLRREAHFTDLRAGNYQFEVVACNHHGLWGETPATFAFHLAPFIHQTWWFYVGCLLVAGGVVRWMVAWRIREVRKIQRLEKVNALNEQRKRIARDIHDEIGASLTQIVHLSESAGRSPALSASAHASWRRIASVAEEAVNYLGEIVWANNPRYDSLEDLVAYLREYAANYFAPTPIEVRFEFPENVDRRPVSGLFRRHLLLLLKEALQNIIKHARASQVEIKLTLAGDRLELCVQDDGRGLAPETASRLGNGLNNMRQRAAELGGSCELRSGPGAGTEVRAVVPLPMD